MTAPEKASRSQENGLMSLIVATYGRSAELKTLFTSLSAQTDRAFEIIIVDQNPDDRIVPVLGVAKTMGLVVHHVRLSEPNLSLARNVGLDHVRGGIVGYPDDDCWYEPGVVAAVRAVFNASEDVSGVVGQWVDKTSGAATRPYRLNSAAWRRFRGGDAPSFTLFFKTECVRAHSGFDVRLGTGRWFGASEETDLILRMLQSGNRIEHTPDAAIHHPFHPAPPLTRAQLRRARSYGRGIGALYSKHRLSPWVRLRGVTAPFLLALRTPKPLNSMALAAATALGRLEGAVRWSMLHERLPAASACQVEQRVE